ncbi:MAG: class I SAM-dependent methyltransferase [Alphaproteobacteria bacterium]
MASTDINAPQTSISGLGRHGVMAELDADDEARLNYQMAFSRHLRENVQSQNKTIYDGRVEPALKRNLGRAPKDRHEVRRAMLEDPAYQWWACMRRHQQEMGSQHKIPIIERQIDALIDKAHVANPAFGTLHLDNEVAVPRYQSAMDMHWMPGSYHAEAQEGDVFAGALYDLGGLYMGTGGKMGPYNDGPGWSVVHWLDHKHPGFAPRSVLDIGCTVGHSTLAYTDAWPDAEIHGLDFSAPLLRYAHGRAESLGRSVHFWQGLAEDTKFPDNSFDLVVSSMFLHETSHKAVYKIAEEAHRVLRPGGLMLHVEQPPFAMMDSAWRQFEMDWDTHNNNEPFWGPMHDMDLADVAVKGGFAPNKVEQVFAPFVVPQQDGTMHVPEKGEWFFFAAWK